MGKTERIKLNSILVNRDLSIRDAMKVLSETQLQILIVKENDNIMHGVVCDGDIRRALLAGADLDSTICDSGAINTDPWSINEGLTRQEILAKFDESKLSRLPILNEDKQVTDLALLENYIIEEEKDNPVVVMVGGQGQRLRPLTENTPKPMLHVAGKPLLERIVDKFKSHGFKNFYFCVNYKSEIIKDYFGDGSKWDINISYIEEEKPLGTAGALKLMPKHNNSMIVINGDILTKINFSALLEHHYKNEVKATMCVKEYEHEVPYGVIKTENGAITALEEKPTHRFFVNAGIYVVNGELVDMIPDSDRFDITQLFELLIEQQKEVPLATVFPVHDYWLDIGRMSDYEKAQRDFANL